MIQWDYFSQYYLRENKNCWIVKHLTVERLNELEWIVFFVKED